MISAVADGLLTEWCFSAREMELGRLPEQKLVSSRNPAAIENKEDVRIVRSVAV
jgi:hypothetical protein